MAKLTWGPERELVMGVGVSSSLSFTLRAFFLLPDGNAACGLWGFSIFTGIVGSRVGSSKGKGVVGSTGCRCTPRGHIVCHASMHLSMMWKPLFPVLGQPVTLALAVALW
jgi:hypothetical protein